MDYKEVEKDLFNRNKKEIDIEVFSYIGFKKAIKEQKEKNKIKALII